MLPAPPALVLVADAGPRTTAGVRCPHFGPCGGCATLDRPYAEELAGKAETFRKTIARQLDLTDVELRPPIAATEPLFYRTSLKVPFGRRRERVVAGFYRRGSHSIVDLNTCAIQHPVLLRLLLLARECVRELGTPIYDERSHQGLLRHLVARVGAGTGESLAGLVVRYDHDRETLRLAERLLERGRRLGLVGVIENVNRERTSQVLGRESRVLAGRGQLREVGDGLELETSLTTFAQVNAAQAEVLYGEVARLLAPLEGRRVVDLFSGYGPIALRLARRGALVHAIEYNERAVQEGRAAAEHNGLAERLTYAAGDAHHLLRTRAASGSIDAIVVDPPRRGLSAGLVELLRDLAVPRLVVVSCYPDTLAPDLRALADVYALRELGTVDLFPRTEHLEAVALLVRRAAGARAAPEP